MDSAEKKIHYSVDEYLEIEEASAFRSQYFNGEIIGMAGGTEEHSRIIHNTNREIGNAIFDRECSVFGGELKVWIEEDSTALYPDGQVICDPVEYYEDRRDMIMNPRLLIEVASESTALFDRTAKFRLYQKLSSLVEYVIIEQKEPQIDVFRKNEKGFWSLHQFSSLQGELELKSLEIKIPIQRIYHRVNFYT